MRNVRQPSLTSNSRFSVRVTSASAGKHRFGWEIVDHDKEDPLQVSTIRYATMAKSFEAAQPVLKELRHGEAASPAHDADSEARDV